MERSQINNFMMPSTSQKKKKINENNELKQSWPTPDQTNQRKRRPKLIKLEM
jgi:hypothetical protein